MADEQPVPPEMPNDEMKGIEALRMAIVSLQEMAVGFRRDINMLLIENIQLKEQVIQLAVDIQQLIDKDASAVSAENKDARPPPDCDPIVHYSENMDFETFVKSTYGKDMNFCYFGDWPLAFYMTKRSLKTAYSAHDAGPTKYYMFMTYMLSHGLNPNMRFHGESLLSATNNALVNSDSELARRRASSKSCKSTYNTDLIMEQEYISQCYRNVRCELRKRGALA